MRLPELSTKSGKYIDVNGVMEGLMGIDERLTKDWSDDNQIPDTDGIEEMLDLKRARAESSVSVVGHAKAVVATSYLIKWTHLGVARSSGSWFLDVMTLTRDSTLPTTLVYKRIGPTNVQSDTLPQPFLIPCQAQTSMLLVRLLDWTALVKG